MNTRNLTCIGCPMGCALKVEMEDNQVIKVSGNTCKKGEEYAKKECTNPTRILTSSVVVIDGDTEVVPVKTEQDIPIERIFDIVKALKQVKVNAPVEIGDVIVKNILGIGVDIIATKKVNKKDEKKLAN